MPRHRRKPRSRRGGFTLIEMLVVIFILALLAAFIVVAVSGIRTVGQDKATRGTIAALQAACEKYFKAWNRFPPDNFGSLGVAEPAAHGALDAETRRTVTGVECLVIALYSRKLGGPFHEARAEGMCDLDKDGLSDAARTYWEFADGWGKPIRYEMLGDTVGVRLWSAGRDMQFGTDDDVRNR